MRNSKYMDLGVTVSLARQLNSSLPPNPTKIALHCSVWIGQLGLLGATTTKPLSSLTARLLGLDSSVARPHKVLSFAARLQLYSVESSTVSKSVRSFAAQLHGEYSLSLLPKAF